MQIQIGYQTWDGQGPVWLTLSPEEYFDPLGPGEEHATNGVPRYNHTWEYLNIPLDRLKWSVERRRGTFDDTTFLTQYMDGGKTWMNHRRDPDGYEEIIHYTQLAGDRCHILRTCQKPHGAWVVALNSVIRDLPDRRQEEQRYDLRWSPEEIAAFTRRHPAEER
jgi:hypothetical protein